MGISDWDEKDFPIDIDEYDPNMMKGLNRDSTASFLGIVAFVGVGIATGYLLYNNVFASTEDLTNTIKPYIYNENYIKPMATIINGLGSLVGGGLAGLVASTIPLFTIRSR